MFVKCNSSRKTGAGLFRAGQVYQIAKGDHKRLAAIKPHLESGAMVKVTQAEAAKAMAAVVQMGDAPMKAAPVAKAKTDAATAAMAADAAKGEGAE